ncbi:T cell receptor beta variable 12-5 [Parambassis ranga]|uniref:T cell receptor beta variable 12-5 n=1 Tax=Parambassis ranga TaxID=210632 RepID=UPI003F4FCC4A
MCLLRQLMMASLQLCMVLVCLCGRRLFAPALPAALPASIVQVRVGQDVALQCPLLDAQTNTTSAAPAGPSTLSWYRKAAGRGLELLLTFRSSNTSDVKYGGAVRPDRVSAAADGALLLHGSEHSDAAVYYCGVSQGDDSKWNAAALSPNHK